MPSLVASWEYAIVLLVAVAGIAVAVQQKKKKKKKKAAAAPVPTAPAVETATSTNFVPPPLPPDFNNVNWLHTNVGNWAETGSLDVTFPRPGVISLNSWIIDTWPPIEIDHTSGTRKIQVNANPWVFVYKNGQWHAGTWEWFVVGNHEKNCKNVAGDHIKQPPLQDWRPKKGETVYFMVSALARHGGDVNVKERTNIVKIIWPDYYT